MYPFVARVSSWWRCSVLLTLLLFAVVHNASLVAAASVASSSGTMTPYDESLLDGLPDGSYVAVVTLLGTLNPITLGHVQAFVEARLLLLIDDDGDVGDSDSPTSSSRQRRPTDLEPFVSVLGYVSLNPDKYVSTKFRNVDGTEGTYLTIDDRSTLVKLAVAEYSWIGLESREGASVKYLKKTYPTLHFVHYVMNGADDVWRNRKWRFALPQKQRGKHKSRFITMGRPGYTEDLVEAVEQSGVKERDFLVGPELPDVSSTAVREALSRGDVDALKGLVHQNVMEWLMEHGPWQPEEEGAVGAQQDVDNDAETKAECTEELGTEKESPR